LLCVNVFLETLKPSDTHTGFQRTQMSSGPTPIVSALLFLNALTST